MADTTEQQILGVNPEVADLSRQKKIAELLMSQGLDQPQGQMISGHYVAPSWAQQLNPMFKAIVGTESAKNADKKELELAAALRGQKAEALTKFQTLMADPATRGQAMQYAASNQFLQPLVTELMKPQKLGEGENLVMPNIGGGEPVNLAGGGAKVAPEVKQAMQTLGINKPLDQLNPQELQAIRGEMIKFKQAGATNLSVNTGQHGFDNALKLRQDFKSEPIYKGFEEIKAAKNQIDQAAQMKSPAGDLAAATKVMKILDPGSVVRESELGMAMAATGLEDRVRNYANLVITGQKLTPAQRKDFVELSDKLYNVAGQQYNNKRNEYAGIAQSNGLSVEAAAGKPVEFKQPAQSSNVRSLADQILQGK